MILNSCKLKSMIAEETKTANETDNIIMKFNVGIYLMKKSYSVTLPGITRNNKVKLDDHVSGLGRKTCL